MKITHVILTALRALRLQRTRSALTVLGIVIGVMAIILIMSLGQGAQQLILDQVSGLGAETITLRPGNGATDFSAIFAQSLTRADVAALERKQNVPNLALIAPSLVMTDQVSYRDEVIRTMLWGGSVEFLAEILDLKITAGEFFTDIDIDGMARVVVIGAQVKEDLFGSEQAIGEHIQIKDQRFRVLGVLARRPNVGGFNINDLVLMPYTSAQTYITGSDYYNEIMMRADSVEAVPKLVYDVTRTLRESHDIRFGDDDDFYIQTQDDVIENIETIVNVFTAFLVAVVAISLVVGGVGIMNIMLVSVSERTKEIGLRKALGARRRDILRQFLTEATILTGLGGVVGILAGTALSFIAALILAETVATEWAFSFPVLGAVLGVGVSVVVGLIFGLYPAYKASRKSPIEALRYE